MRSLSYRYSDPEDANWEVSIDKVRDLINTCGSDLKNFESFYLLRRSNYVSQLVEHNFLFWPNFICLEI